MPASPPRFGRASQSTAWHARWPSSSGDGATARPASGETWNLTLASLRGARVSTMGRRGLVGMGRDVACVGLGAFHHGGRRPDSQREALFCAQRRQPPRAPTRSCSTRGGRAPTWRLAKSMGINAIRTSHYPPHLRVRWAWPTRSARVMLEGYTEGAGEWTTLRRSARADAYLIARWRVRARQEPPSIILARATSREPANLVRSRALDLGGARKTNQDSAVPSCHGR